MGRLARCAGPYPSPIAVPSTLPPPCRSPPLVVPRGGGGGPSLGQPKIFRCGLLCCCVRDCVVGHYHLHPLHSWQDILLTFGEMEFDSTTIFPPGTSVTFIRSTGEPVLAQVVGRSEHGLYFTRDIPEGKWVPKNLLAPAKPPKSAAPSIPVESGEHVQEFKVKWSRTKKFYTEPVKE